MRGSHQGTHLDAPYHFRADGPTVDQIGLERFFGPATLVDFAPDGALPPRTHLGIDPFAPHADRFTPGARVLYRTGWDRQFGRPEFFTEFPTLMLDAARWIAERRIGLLGMDTPTPSVDFLEGHLLLLAPGVEIRAVARARATPIEALCLLQDPSIVKRRAVRDASRSISTGSRVP